MDPEVDAEALLAALETLEAARAADVADWLGRPAGAVTSALKDLEKRGRTRRSGDLWSVVVSAPVASASPSAPRAFIAPPPDPTPPPDASVRPPVRRVFARTPAPPAPVVHAPRRRERPSPKVALIDANRDLIGTLPDAAVAAKLGVSPAAITSYRRRAMPSKVAAPAAPAPAVKPSPKRALLEANHALVGSMFDSELAAKLDVGVETVRQYRTTHGIPAASKRAAPAQEPAEAPAQEPASSAPASTKLGIVAENHDRLGTISDARLAKELGVSLATIARYRVMVHLPAAPRVRAAPPVEERPPAPVADTATPRPAPAPVAGIVETQLWTIRFDDDSPERTVVAPTIDAAAALAVEAFPARVMAVVLVGEAVTRR